MASEQINGPLPDGVVNEVLKSVTKRGERLRDWAWSGRHRTRVCLSYTRLLQSIQTFKRAEISYQTCQRKPCLRFASYWPKICSSRDTLGIYLCNYQKFLQLSLANFRRRQGGCAEKPIPRSCDNTVGCHQRSDCLVVFVVMRFFLYLGQISNGRNFHPHQYRKVPSSLKFQMHHRHHQLSPFAVMISCIFQNAPCRNIVSNKYQAHSFVLSILSTYWTFEFTSGPPTLLGSCCTTSKYLWWYRNPLSPPNGWLFDIVNLFW